MKTVTGDRCAVAIPPSEKCRAVRSRAAAQCSPCRRVWTGAAFASAVLGFSAWVSAVPANGVRGNASGTVALIFHGRPITVRKLTTIGYRQGILACTRACNKWPPKRGPAPISFLLGGPAAWSGPSQGAGKRFYLAMLQHVLDEFLEYQVVRQMERQYHPKTAGYIDRIALAKAIPAQSKALGCYYRFLLRAATGDASFVRFYADLKRNYPATIYGSLSTTRAFWHKLLESRAYLYALVNCFPAWNTRTGMVGPSSRYWIYRGIVQVELGLIYKQDPAKYVAINDTRFGRWNLEVVSPISKSAKSKSSALGLIKSTSDRAGKVTLFGLGMADRALAALESPTRVGVAVGAAFSIRDMYGIKFSQLEARKLIRTNPHSGAPHAYVFLLQSQPPRATDPTDWAPGSTLYGTYYEAILLPIAERVLRDARPMVRGLKLPSPKALTDNVFTNPGYLDGGLMLGKPVPRVRLRLPWPPLH